MKLCIERYRNLYRYFRLCAVIIKFCFSCFSISQANGTIFFYGFVNISAFVVVFVFYSYWKIIYKNAVLVENILLIRFFDALKLTGRIRKTNCADTVYRIRKLIWNKLRRKKSQDDDASYRLGNCRDTVTTIKLVVFFSNITINKPDSKL